jgi:hypothetical protein
MLPPSRSLKDLQNLIHDLIHAEGVRMAQPRFDQDVVGGKHRRGRCGLPTKTQCTNGRTILWRASWTIIRTLDDVRYSYGSSYGSVSGGK